MGGVAGKGRWLNKNIFAMGLTSFFSDFGHEMATAVLPAFLLQLGGSAALLGLIEGVADASISGMKLFSGWLSDRLGKRKPLAAIGYMLTALGVGSFSLAFSWPQVLLSRVVAWLGRGTREPPRDAMLVDSTEPQYHGRVFGFHRAMDTVGAIIGPAAAFFLIKGMELHTIFLIALIPSLLAFLTMVTLVKETRRQEDKSSRFIKSVKNLPRNFKFFLAAVAVFGLGNFADSMLILRATDLLSPGMGAAQASSMAILLYTLHNVLYAGASFPIGIIGDRLGNRNVLILGYVLTGITSVGFICNTSDIVFLGVLFVFAGIAIAITDAMEKAVAADLLPEDLRGTGYGTLASVNGLGDFASSALVGLLWTSISPVAGFGYAAILCIAGGVALISMRYKTQS